MLTPRWRSITLNLLAASLLLICLLPILRTGYLSDDVMNYQFRDSNIGNQSKSTIELCIPYVKEWMLSGRFTPVVFWWNEFTFRYFTPLVVYKAFMVLMNLLAIGVFMWYLRVAGFKINRAIWLVFLCSLIQFRLQYHDAYTSLNGMYQLIALLVFGGLGLCHLYVTKRKLLYLMGSLACYATVLLVTELGAVLLLLLPISLWAFKTPIRTIIKTVAMFLPVTLIYGGYVFYLKKHIPVDHNTYTGLVANLQPAAMLRVAVAQIGSVLPLTNLTDHHAIPSVLLSRLNNPVNVFAVVLILVLAAAVYYLYNKEQQQSERPIHNYRPYILGLAIAIFPALFLTPSIKYQQEIRFGAGYLPIFLQNFGMATLLALLFHWIASKVKLRPLAMAFYSFLSLAIGVNYLFNAALIDQRQYDFAAPMQFCYESIKDGIAKSCPDNSIIITGSNFFWRISWQFQNVFNNVYGRPIHILDEEFYKPRMKTDTPPEDWYFLEVQRGSTISVALYKFDNTTGKKGELVEIRKTTCSAVPPPE